MSPTRLPAGFEDLESLMGWSLETMSERSARRQASDFSELEAFYNAMLPRMRDVLAHLVKIGIDDAPPDAKALVHLAYSFAEVAPAVERFGRPDVPYGFDVARFVPRPD